LLSVAAVLGLLMGAMLARPPPEEENEAMLAAAEATAERMLPMGAPVEVGSGKGGDPMAADPRSLYGIPPYPNAVPRRLSDQTQAMGMPMVASWFTTTDRLDEVLNFYVAAYQDAGVPIVSHQFDDQAGYVAWMDEEGTDAGFAEGPVHMISAIRNTPSSTETIVLLSASRPQRLLEAAQQVPEAIVLPGEVGAPQVVQMGSEGRVRTVVTTRKRGALTPTVEEIIALMRRDGWKVGEVMAAEGGASWMGTKRGMNQMVSATLSGDEVSLMYSLEQDKSSP
jgi:hypothetical protein